MLVQRIAAAGGCELIADTTLRTGKDYFAFIVQEDTVFTSINGGVFPATDRDYVTEIGLSGKTLKQGALIVVREGERITRCQLASGSVIAYYEARPTA